MTICRPPSTVARELAGFLLHSIDQQAEDVAGFPPLTAGGMRCRSIIVSGCRPSYSMRREDSSTSICQSRRRNDHTAIPARYCVLLCTE